MADGRRFDAAGRPAPLAPGDLAAAARRLGAIRSAATITRPDAYYYEGHDVHARLPAYRVELADGVRFYLDPTSGQVLQRIDRDAKGYRWLFNAPHRFDFVDGVYGGVGWTVVMTLLLLISGAGVATGVWLGWRRTTSDLGQLTKKAPKAG